MRTGLFDQCESMGWGTDRLQDMKHNVKPDISLTLAWHLQGVIR
jgi:hypothetical protein